MRTIYSSQSGFTMIELIITMGIFTILVSVVLANYRTFSSRADFLNVADSIALSLREAQIYGVGSKGASNSAGTAIVCSSPASAFNCAYGVSFNVGDGFYTVFADKDNNKASSGGSSELIETILLPMSTTITSLKCTKDGSSAVCGTSGRADVTFKRPDPDAVITPVNGVNPISAEQDSLEITVKNATKNSVVTITRAGQISVVTNNN